MANISFYDFKCIPFNNASIMQFEHVLTPETPFNTQDFSKVLIPKVGMQLDILKSFSS